jgi:type II secretory pathway pseudopilin PulG
MLRTREEESGLALIRLMIILIIIGFLFVALISSMKGSADETKWAEGRAVACSIRTAADNFRREKGTRFDYSGVKLSDLGFVVNPGRPGGDFDGKYFSDDCYVIKFSKNSTYLITVDATKSITGDPPIKPRIVTLDSKGQFSETP